jgi:transposase InsO family protein
MVIIDTNPIQATDLAQVFTAVNPKLTICIASVPTPSIKHQTQRSQPNTPNQTSLHSSPFVVTSIIFVFNRIRTRLRHPRSSSAHLRFELIYNRTVRHEWLDQYIIESIEEAQDQATRWLWTYNNNRPNMGIGGITPAIKLKMVA